MGKFFLIIAFLLFEIIHTNAQESGEIHSWIHLPTSLNSLGMGEQSVALQTSDDALTYNPANLTYSANLNINFFRLNHHLVKYIPRTNISLSTKIKNIGAFGFDIKTWDFGKTTLTTPESPEIIKRVEYYYRSYSLGVARKLHTNLSLGVNLRYSYFQQHESIATQFTFGIGINYCPKELRNRFSAGFSILNLSSKGEDNIESSISEESLKIEYTPPTVIHFGVFVKPIECRYFSIGFQSAVSKYLAEKKAKSSFDLLFSDWEDFPEDLRLSTGLNFEWKNSIWEMDSILSRNIQ